MTDVKKYTVYILEENKDLLKNIKDSLLATNNFTVIGNSDSAVSCLNYLSNNTCDLLIIDLMLSNIDGIGVLNKLKEINNRAYNKVVCITSFTNPLICETLEKLNVSYCFKQPFDINYNHHHTGETNGDSHLKSLLIGHEVIIPVTNGKLDFGPWQQVYYAEFDGQRRKRVLIKVMGE